MIQWYWKMAYSIVADKLKCVLYKFSDSNYKVFSGDDVYLQKLATLLTEPDISRKASSHVNARLPLCVEWVVYAADVWANSPPHPSVAAFALRLAGANVGDAWTFRSLQCAGTLDRFLISLRPHIDRNGFVTVAYVSMLSELLQHDDGCHWIMETDVWLKIIKLALENSFAKVCRESYKFISILVIKLQAKNDFIGCKKILDHIMEVLNLANVNCGGEALKEDDKSLAMAALPFLCNILEAVMLEPGVTVTLVLLEKYHLESLLWNFIKQFEEDVCIEKFLKILVLLYFVLFEKMRCDKTPTSHIICFKTSIFDMLSYFSVKGYMKTILYVCFECFMYLRKFNISSIKFEEKSKLYEIKSQLLLFQVIPVLCYEKNYNTTRDMFLPEYVQKVFDLVCEDTVRLVYSLRNYLLSNDIDPTEYSKCGLIYIMQLESCLDKEQAGIVCQALIYALKSFGNILPDEYVVQHFDVLSMILDGLSDLLDHFQISWREGAECTILFSEVEMLVKKFPLPSTVSVKALRLMQVAVRNYLPPNLALLVNTMGGSAIQELGPLLLRYLHDPCWDVRDSALELLHTVTDVSHEDFPAFQEHIMENGLCTATLALMVEDDESYVRASALKCMAAMVKVPRFWDGCLSSQDLPNIMISILMKEGEGLVRKEAALVMMEMYHLQNIPKPLEEKVLAAMMSAATHDLYWEVKVNALCFWEKVIEHHLSRQGMIDGRFPSVTFSKEHRKIVTLTRDQIKLRIYKALEELSFLGCLQVLLSAIHDCDLQVARKAVTITTSVSSLLSRYDMLPAGGEADLGDDGVRQSSQESSKGDTILGQDQAIVNGDTDTNLDLLSTACLCQMNVSNTSACTALARVKPMDFLSVLAVVDLQDMVSERSHWINNCGESLNCLLDDILFAHGDRENMIAECY